MEVEEKESGHLFIKGDGWEKAVTKEEACGADKDTVRA